MTPTGGLWSDLLGRLEEQVPKHAFDAWIRPLVVYWSDKDQKKLILFAPGRLCRDRVEAKYKTLITDALLHQLNRPVKISILVSDGSDLKSETYTRQSVEDVSKPEGSSYRKQSPSFRSARHDLIASKTKLPNEVLPAIQLKSPRTVGIAPIQTTFDSFCVGESNALAREASFAVARGEQEGLLSLCLVGDTGLGKTHLARALVQEARVHGRRNVLYMSAESFTNEFTNSLRNKSTVEFKRRFRQDCNLLVLEDLQFLAGKKWTQLELFHTFEHLRVQGVPVVCTSNRQPREIEKLDSRLKSQVSAGLVAEISSPEKQLRREILKKMASHGGINLPQDCLDRMVDTVQGSVRDLEGVLAQVVVTSSLLKRKIDLTLVEQSLRKLGNPKRLGSGHSIESVTSEVCNLFKVSLEELRKKSRKREILYPRQLAMFFAFRLTDEPVSKIGAFFQRDHPAVRNAVQSIERKMLSRAPQRYRIEELASRLDAASIVETSLERRKKPF